MPCLLVLQLLHKHVFQRCTNQFLGILCMSSIDILGSWIHEVCSLCLSPGVLWTNECARMVCHVMFSLDNKTNFYLAGTTHFLSLLSSSDFLYILSSLCCTKWIFQMDNSGIMKMIGGFCSYPCGELLNQASCKACEEY